MIEKIEEKLNIILKFLLWKTVSIETPLDRNRIIGERIQFEWNWGGGKLLLLRNIKAKVTVGHHGNTLHRPSELWWWNIG